MRAPRAPSSAVGAWDVGAFDNDTAMDWVADLERQGSAAVTTALTATANAHGFVDAFEGEQAIAAAEVVASALGQPGPELPDAVRAWIASSGGALSPDLTGLAEAAVTRVLSDSSELRELWVDDAEDEAWLEAVHDLRRRLTAASGPRTG